MNFKLKKWVRNMKFNAQLNSPEIKKTASFFKTSLISILVGTLLTMILVGGLGANPISFFIKTFEVVFTRDVNLQNALSWFAVYGLFAIGLAIGFKVGLFNMSGSGQALLSMGITGLMLISMFGNSQIEINKASSGIIILIFIIMVVMSMLLSSITGILKVFFNIHEVATSILLNWTVWYLMKWAFTLEGFNSSSPRIPTDWIAVGGSKWLIPLILMVLVFISTWFVLTFTTLGYKFKLVGTQKDAANYIGINYKKYIISATAIQGLCIGAGSFVYWCAIKGQYSLSNDIIPTIGFDAIAISLIAFNNILGILPISFLWAILTVGMPVAVTSFSELGREIAPLIFGFIVYASTFASLFARLQPIKWIKFYVYYFKDVPNQIEIKKVKDEIKELKLDIKQINKGNFEKYSNLEKLSIKVLEEDVERNVIEQFHTEKREAIIILKRHIDLLKGDIQYLKEIGYEKYSKSGFQAIKSSYKMKIKRNSWNLLNPAIKSLNAIEEEHIDLLLDIKKTKKSKFNSQSEYIKNLKKIYKSKLKEIKDEYRLEISQCLSEIKLLKKNEEIDMELEGKILEVKLKIEEIKNKFEVDKNNLQDDLTKKLIISEEQVEKFNEKDIQDLENREKKLIELKEQFSTWKEKEKSLNEKWFEEINKLKEQNNSLLVEQKENWSLASEAVNTFNETINQAIVEYRNKINEKLQSVSDKEELSVLKLEKKKFIQKQKVMKYEKKLELGEKYGCR